MKVRGKPSGGISTLTPTLSRKRERGIQSIFPALDGVVYVISDHGWYGKKIAN
jgi:hypothetical protein